MASIPVHRRLAAVLLALAAVAPAAGGAFTVVDARGREVAFPRPAERIAVAGRAVGLLVNTLYLFPGARERVVAIPDPSQQMSAEFLSLLDPGLAAKALLGGGGAGAEQIAPFRPDVVLLKSASEERIGRPLERLGFRVVYLEGESPERFLAEVALLGRLLGDEPRAVEIAAYYQGRRRMVAERLAGLPAGERPRVLFLSASSRGDGRTFTVPPADWLQHRLIADAGGASSGDSGLPGTATVSGEQVAAWHPDRIVVARYRGDSREVVARLRTDPLWSALPAVRAGRLDAFPGDYYSWDQPDPRWLLGQLWLAKTLHPERFPDLDLRAEILSFFRVLYGLPEETVRARILPVLTGDLPR